jgi:uncharacterized membrane protein
MKPIVSRDTNLSLDGVVAKILQVGVVIAASVVLLGGVVFLVHHGGETFGFRTFKGEPADLCSVSGILKGALSFSGRGMIQLGLLLLVATPVVRVFFLMFAFAARKDKTYVIITLIVLANLLLGLTGII